MRPGAIAVIVGDAQFAVNIKFAAGAWAVVVDSTAHFTADIAKQCMTAHWLGFRALHAGAMGCNLMSQYVGDQPARTLALSPIKRNPKIGTAGAAGQAGRRCAHRLVPVTKSRAILPLVIKNTRGFAGFLKIFFAALIGSNCQPVIGGSSKYLIWAAAPRFAL